MEKVLTFNVRIPETAAITLEVAVNGEVVWEYEFPLPQDHNSFNPALVQEAEQYLREVETVMVPRVMEALGPLASRLRDFR